MGGGGGEQQDPARCLGESVLSPHVHLISSHVPPTPQQGGTHRPANLGRAHAAHALTRLPKAADLGFFHLNI